MSSPALQILVERLATGDIKGDQDLTSVEFMKPTYTLRFGEGLRP
jgi:hypothetical protein